MNQKRVIIDKNNIRVCRLGGRKNVDTHVKVLMRTIHRGLVASAPDCNMQAAVAARAQLQQLSSAH